MKQAIQGGQGYIITTAVRDESVFPFAVRFFGPGKDREAEEYAAGLGGRFTIFKSRRPLTAGEGTGCVDLFSGYEEPVEGWPFLSVLGMGIDWRKDDGSVNLFENLTGPHKIFK